MKDITLNKPELLDKNKHDRKGFSCGIKKLDVFLKEQARKESPELSRTFVLTGKENPGKILGFYSLSATKIRLDDLPQSIQKKLGHYGALPATLLGRLAVDAEFQGCGLRLGEILLIDAELRSWKASQSVASFALVVDVLVGEKGDPTKFYENYGFIKCVQTDNLLYLPMKTIEQSLKKSGLI